MTLTRSSNKLIDPLKLKTLFAATTQAAEGDKQKEAAYRAVIASLIGNVAALGLLHTAAQELLKGHVAAQNRLVAILRLLMAVEPVAVEGLQPASAQPPSRSQRNASNPDRSPSGLGLLPSTNRPPCFLFPQDIFPLYFGSLFPVPEEAAGPVIQYLDRQLAKISPLDLLYDLAEGVLAGEDAAPEMFRSTLEILEVRRPELGAPPPRSTSGISRFLDPSEFSRAGTPQALIPMSGEIPPRLFPMPYCVGIRDECIAETVRAVREAQAMRAGRGACVIESVEPSRAAVGDEIVITGSNFGGTSGEVVFPGNIRGVIDEWTDTEITTTVPLGTRPGLAPICLRIPLGSVRACGASIDVYTDGCCIEFCVLRRVVVQLWAGADAYHHTHSSTEGWAERIGECNLIGARNMSAVTIELSYTEGPQEPPPGTGVELSPQGPPSSTAAFNGSPISDDWVWWANVIEPADRQPGIIDIELTCNECA